MNTTPLEIDLKISILTHPSCPASLIESSLETCSKRALPGGDSAEREKWKQHWRRLIWSQRGERPRKPPGVWLEECKVHTKTTHNKQSDSMGLDRSVYFELKAGRRVSDGTRIKAARYISAKYAPCTALDLKAD